MARTSTPFLLAGAAVLALAGCGGSSDSAPPPSAGKRIPTIDPAVADASRQIDADAGIQAVLKDLATPENIQDQFDTHMELVRIATPSRQEFRRAAEIERRLVNEWGFSPSEVKTRADGYLAGSNVQMVDGLPVYNVCVEIKGSYSGTPGAQNYRGQYPKVLFDSQLDAVFPARLPPASNPYEPIKLQLFTDPVVASPAQLAALPDELHFDAAGRIVRDANYLKARRYYPDAETAERQGAVRLYVAGIDDPMYDTTAVFTIARMLKKHRIRPVYDLWFCGTSGEEGKGNLAGMKQIYGYDQNTGKGTNPLNIVSHFGVGGGNVTVNFIGSIRFEMKYTAPRQPAGAAAPNPLMAVAATMARIADIKTPWDEDPSGPKVTYTIGVVDCAAPPAGSSVVPSCTVQVDMRAPKREPLDAIRARIEPLFQAGVSEENARYGAANNTDAAVRLELVWFGERPASERQNLNDVAIQASWQAAAVAGVDEQAEVPTGSTSTNDNLPAGIGVPTVGLSVGTTAAGGGMHAFNEWAVPGDSARQNRRIYRVMMSALIASGFHTADGRTVPPAAGPIGVRTAELAP